MNLAGFGLFAVFWPYCSVFFHETGCVIFAKLAGMNPYKVRVGKGKILFVLKLLTVEFEFCDCPVSGFTFTNHGSLDKLKSRTLLLLLGRLSANCVIIVIIITAWKFFDDKLILIYAMFIEVCQLIARLSAGRSMIAILSSKSYSAIKTMYHDIYKELNRYQQEHTMLPESFLNNDLSMFAIFLAGVNALSANNFTPCATF
ncbi:MAG: hypothetical protein HQK67_13110 [Desulfamplus sp.]|nr:hypothetical protein [Desulfamplus sp.]